MVNIHTLPNGLKVVLEKIDHVRSASIGLFIKAGSMLESKKENGYSHFLEHMAFKGTEHRTVKEFAKAMDAIGGQMNASTSKANTVYYARVLDSEMEQAIELLADMTLHPLLDEEELEKEKGVVLEEIAMANDVPEDVLFDALNRALYGSGTLSRTILGEARLIERLTKADVLRYREKYYSPHNALLSITGNFDQDAVLTWVETYFGVWQGSNQSKYPINHVNQTPDLVAIEKPIEQAHLLFGWQGVEETHRDLYAVSLLSSILGEGMSSRLFQTIREERGLVYTVSTMHNAYPRCGDFNIYAASTPQKAVRVVPSVFEVVERLLSDGIEPWELEQAKVLLKTSLVLSQESGYQRMYRNGFSVLLIDKVKDVEEVLQKLDAVTTDDVLAVGRRMLTAPFSCAVVGPSAAQIMDKVRDVRG